MQFEHLIADLTKKLNDQLAKYPFDYGAAFVVPASGSATVQITIEADADFAMSKMMGRFFGPCDANGIVVPGANDFPNPANVNLASSGLSIKITDQGAGRTLTSDFVPVELLFSPGYDTVMYDSLPWAYTFRRQSVVQMEFRNRDSVAGNYHAGFIMLHGHKYLVKANA